MTMMTMMTKNDTGDENDDCDYHYSSDVYDSHDSDIDGFYSIRGFITF